jgi:hypothetical protein
MKLNSTICHVGYTQSFDDMSRVVQVSEWCLENDVIYPTEPVFLDLNYGDSQDFLKMDTTHDMVILHYICRFEKFQAERVCQGVMRPTMRVSAKASWANWRRRLMGTNAHHMFLFGGMGEVSGPYIAQMDGYSLRKLWEDDGKVRRECWLFRKEKV